LYIHVRNSSPDKCASDEALSQKTVEISQKEVEVLAKDRQYLEQVFIKMSIDKNLVA